MAKKIREKKLEGTMIRARARWVEQGEKPSSYFCSLENRNFVSKRMSLLVKENDFENVFVSSVFEIKLRSQSATLSLFL